MANPPITIGPFTNVPAPGSAIASAWAQQLTQYAVDVRARQPAPRSAVGAGGGSGGALADIHTLTIPAQPIAGVVLIWSYLRADFNGGTGYTLSLMAGAVEVANRVFPAAHVAAGASWFVSLSAAASVPINTATKITLNGAGAANITTYADLRVNRLDTLFVPNVGP